jgi:hypothetical protein
VNFPTKNAAQPQPGSSPGSEGTSARDGFAAKFNTDLAGEASLIYSTFLGGPERDEGQGIAIDPATNAYVTGFTGRQSGVCCPSSADMIAAPNAPLASFPVTPGGFQETAAGGEDAFLVEVAGGGFIAASSDAGFILSGRVTRSSDGAPVAGVTITLTRPNSTTSTTTTNSDGVYFFERSRRHLHCHAFRRRRCLYPAQPDWS